MVTYIENTFAALADPTRFRVVEVLRGGDLAAGELAHRCSMSGPAMSRHLRVLRNSGLVEVIGIGRTTKDARVRVYRLRPHPFRSIRNWIEHMEAFWTDQLESFKSYAEEVDSTKKPSNRRLAREAKRYS